MTGDKARGDAVADRWRETFEKNRRESDLAVTRLEVRAEQRSAPDIEEDTGVIHREALARQAKAERGSDPPKAAKGMVAVLKAVQTPAQALVALAIVAAIVVLILHGWKP